MNKCAFASCLVTQNQTLVSKNLAFLFCTIYYFTIDIYHSEENLLLNFSHVNWVAQEEGRNNSTLRTIQ